MLRGGKRIGAGRRIGTKKEFNSKRISVPTELQEFVKALIKAFKEKGSMK